MALVLDVDPEAPIQVGNPVVLRVRFVTADGTPRDVSDSDEQTIKLEDPNGDAVHVVAALESDGEDGWIVGTYAHSKFGRWRIQGRVRLSAGPPETFLHTSRASYPVEANLPDPA